MEISMVKEWLANWAPGIQLVAAAVIAFSSICTLAILLKQNKTKGWLKVNGRRFWRLSYYETPRLREDGTWGLPGPTPGADEGGPEIFLNVINTGYLVERVLQIQYHVKGKGWDTAFPLAPIQPSGTPEESSPASGSAIRNYEVDTPFDVKPQHTTGWHYKLRGINRADPPLITCVRLETAKESIHVRLLGIGGHPPHPGEWFGVLCKFGIHR